MSQVVDCRIASEYLVATGHQPGRDIMHEIQLRINGKDFQHDVEARLLLVHYIREKARLTGTHVGCDTGHCGACTVTCQGRAIKSCMMLAVGADGF